MAIYDYLFRLCRFIGLTLLAAEILCGAALAQEQVLEEVLVTAQKREQNLQEVAVAITAFSGDELRLLRIKQLSDLGAHTPGLTTANAQSGSVPIFSIRGIGLDDFNVNNSSSVGVYIDQVFASSPVFLGMQMMDVASVEVLKGPQGALYGERATAGVIKITSAKPTEEFGARLIAGYGRFGEVNIEGFVSGPLSDAVRGRVVVSTIQGGDYQTDIYTGNRYGDNDKLAARAMLDFDLGASAKLLLNFRAGHEKSTPARPVIAYDGDFRLVELGLEGGTLADGFHSARDVESSFMPYIDSSGFGASAIIDWTLSFADFTSITAYDEYDFKTRDNFDGRGSVWGDIINDVDLEQASQEFRLTSNNGGDFTWIAGLNFILERSNGNVGALIGDTYSFLSIYDDPFFGGPGFYTSLTGNAPLANEDPFSTLADLAYNQEINSFGAYLHTETQLGKKFSLTLALRYSHDNVKFQADVLDYTAFADASNSGAFIAGSDAIWLLAATPTTVLSDGRPVRTGGVGGPGEDEGRESEDNVSGRIGLDYMASDNLLLYASVSTGYKGGRYFSLAVPTSDYLFYVRPEELLAYEIGFKSTLSGGSLQLNGAAYYYDFEDRQSLILDEINVLFLANIPKSEVSGGELELRWLPTKGLDIKAGVSYIDAVVNKGPGAGDLGGNIPKGNVVHGTRLSQSPEWSWNFITRYNFSLNDRIDGAAQLDYSYQDVQIASVSDPGALYGPTRSLGARLAISSYEGGWVVALWGRNLTDEEGETYAQTSFASEPMRFLQKPRSYGVEVTYNW